MKKNLPKFLVTHNEAAKPDATYIVHTQEPSFVGEIITFSSLVERNNYRDENADKEIIVITPTTLLIILKYLESSDRSSRKEFLHKRVGHWIVSNYLNPPDKP